MSMSDSGSSAGDGLRSAPSYDAPAAADEAGVGGLGLGQVARILRMRWWMPVLGAGLALGVARYMVPADSVVHRAGAVVLLDDARRSLTGALAREADNVTAADFMATQIQLIHSRTVAGQAVDATAFRLSGSPELSLRLLHDVAVQQESAPDTLHLVYGDDGFRVRGPDGRLEVGYGVPVETGGVRFTLAARPAQAESGFLVVMPRERAIDALLQGVRATQRGGGGRGGSSSGFIDISYRDRDPVRAQHVVNAVAEAYRAQNFSTVQERSQRRREFIEELLGQAESTLHSAQGELSAFRSQGRLYSSRDRLLSEQSSLMSLDVRREELQAERRMATALLQRVERAETLTDQEIRTLVAAPGISSSTLVSQVFGQLVGYQTERERLLAAGRAPSHPDVERLSSLIEGTRAAFVDAVRSHIGSLDLRVAALDDMRGRSAGTIQSLPEVEAEESTLLQNIQMAQQMVGTLREEYQRARIAEAAEVGQVQIVDFASFASPERSGRRLQTLAIATVLGLLLGGGGALLIEVQNSSIRRREEMEGLLRVPGLGLIPRLNETEPTGWRRLPGARARAATPATAEAGRLVASHAQSLGVEAYRQLGTNLYFSQPGQRLRTVVVTSPTSGEGKTTTTANLAVTLARKGMRVLLVDCDLRRPRLHHVFGVDRDPGFTDLLHGRAAPAAAIRETGVERLFLLPRGAFDIEAIDMLSADRTRRLLESLAQQFDVVLIDTSPTLVAADAAVLGALADGVVLVVRAGSTSRDDAREAMTQLSTVGARVIGSVLNDPDATTERYGNYYYRYYGEYAVTE